MDFHHVIATEGDGCLMCAVRALTEGVPAVKNASREYQLYQGTVMRGHHV